MGGDALTPGRRRCPRPPARSSARPGGSRQRPGSAHSLTAAALGLALLPLSCWASSLTASPGATSFLPAPPPALLLPTALACHPVAPLLER